MAGPLTACRCVRRPPDRDHGRSGHAAPLERVPRVARRCATTRSAIRCAPRFARSASWCRWTSTSRRRSCSATTCTSPRTRRTGWRMPSATADMARRRFGLGRGSLVVELASNDGYLLKNFHAAWASRCSASIPRIPWRAAAEHIGVPTLVEFFGETLAQRARRGGPAGRSRSSPTTCWRTCRSSTTSSPASRRS